ncbi:MAG: PD-(D/E)XK nuclease family protein [Planctomycetota bacterium]
MARPAADIESFFNLTEVQRLLDIARSDNALIALAVHRREICWTQFMGWLLDPGRVPAHISRERTADLIHIALSKLPDQTANPDGGRLVQIHDRKLETVLDVSPEQSAGKAGRIDLVVCTRFGKDTLHLLIENKIDATEHTEQLTGYVAYYLRKRTGELLLPILIELGDNPAEISSCSWAPCLTRSDITEWLGRLDDAPSIAHDYRTIFEAWNIGAQLRVRYQKTIDKILSMKEPPEDWRLIKDSIVANEQSFYQVAFNTPLLANALDDFGFSEPESMGRLKAEHAILVLAKPKWTIYPGEHKECGVQIHFECDGRGRLRMDVRNYPYEGSIENKPDRMVGLADQLALKAELQERVRAVLQEVKLPGGVALNQSGLRKPQSPADPLAES